MHGTMPQGLKRFEVHEMLFRALKPNLNVQSDSIRAKVFLESISSHPLMLILRAKNRFKCCSLHDLIHIFLDNGVMTTPKRRILSFVFTVLNHNNNIFFNY